jgi:hypothetical protein
MAAIVRNIQWFIIITLMLVVFLQRECHRCPKCPEPLKPDTLYMYDSIPVTPPPITPKPGRVEDVELPVNIDTMAIVREYFAKRYGEDTLIDSRDLFLSLRWEVQENRPTMFQPTIINRKPTTVISYHLDQPRNKVFAGIYVGGNAEQFGAGPEIALLTKQDNLYTLNYDIVNKTINGGVMWKIRIKKQSK